MSSYYTGVICKNGHCISSYGERISDKFCPTCGAEIIHNCLKCGETIRGVENYEYSYLLKYVVPSYCWKCGGAFPWTESALEAAIALISEDEKLSEFERSRLSESLPDIITETPRTQLATVRIKKALLSAGKITAESLRQFVIEFGCEFVKRQLNIP